jgi:hypothetical protein
MAEPPDFQDLARRYLDLWQEQWSAMSADPEAAEAMSRLYDMMGQQMAAAAPMAEAFLSALPAILGPFANPGQTGPGQTGPGQTPPGQTAHGQTPPGTRGSHDAADAARSAAADEPPGAAPAGPAPDGGAVDVAELLGRIAALEDRIAKLEAKRPARRPAAKPRPRKD